jgi:hypothetical protein
MAASDSKVECDPVKNTHSNHKCDCPKGSSNGSSRLNGSTTFPVGMILNTATKPSASWAFLLYNGTMLGIMRAGSRRRHEARVARAQACIAAGCKCYCHDRSEPESLLGILLMCILTVSIVGVPLMGLAWLIQRDQAEHPPMPYVCNSITSTGAPADCHPAILPPDVLKKYEDHFKK